MGINAIRSLGYTRVLLSSAVQFNSIFFRTVAGISPWLLPQAISIITTVEFILNFAFELPFGILADSKGRLKAIVVGLVFTIFSLIATMLSTFWSHQTHIAGVLLVFSGLFLGFGKPMFSGALEAFYQEAIIKHHETDYQASFLLSNIYGKYLTSVVLIAVFCMVFICVKFNTIVPGILFGCFLYLILIGKISIDSKQFSAIANETAPEPLKPTLREVISELNFHAYFGTILTAYNFFNGVFILNYLIASLGREYRENSPLTFISMFAFGYFALGWIIKAHILPKLAKYQKRKFVLLISTLLFGSCTFICHFIFHRSNFFQKLLVLLVVGIAIQLFQSLIRDFSVNAILNNSKKVSHATILSLTNLPGYLVSASVTFYYLTTPTGLPNVETIFKVTTVGAIIFALILVLIGKFRKDF